MMIWLSLVLMLMGLPHAGMSGAGQESHTQQFRSTPDRRADDSVERETRKLFQLVREGIQGGKLSLFARELSPQVIVNLGGPESGYYSSSQAYYLLEEHFRTRKVDSVDFEVIHASDSAPYATGTVVYTMKGSQERAQIYVSLTQSGGRWTISQITIY